MVWGISHILAGALSVFSIGSGNGILRSTLTAAGDISQPDTIFQVVDTSIHKVLTIRENSQQTFLLTVPAGNYSGISRINDSLYVVADDKSITDGFRYLHLDIDGKTGKIITAVMDTLVTNGRPNRDSEGIAYVPDTDKLMISGEADKSILEYNLDGTLTGRSLEIPPIFNTASDNLGFEALTYSPDTHLFWTTTESTLPEDGMQATSTNGVRNLLRLQSFDEGMRPVKQFAYMMDAPTAKKPAAIFAHGVSEITALDDGRLIVLEREFFVPYTLLGAYVNCKLYLVSPVDSLCFTLPDSLVKKAIPDSLALPKTEICEFRTNLIDGNLANYEGMCLGSKLEDGSQTLILISDSQKQYLDMLKDWFKVIKI